MTPVNQPSPVPSPAEALEAEIRAAAEAVASEREALRRALIAKHGDEVHELETQGHRAYFLSPPRPEWRRFMKFSMSPDKRSGALEELTTGCVVHVGGGTAPMEKAVARQMLDKLYDRKPGLAETFGNGLTKLAGLDDAADAKKL
jgi:hypothetical protein